MSHLAAPSIQRLSAPPDATNGRSSADGVDASDASGVLDERHRLAEFAQLVQALSAAPDETVRLQLAVDSTVKLVTRCDHAGITINAKRGLFTRLSSDDVGQRADELQLEMGEGPCLDVAQDQDTLVSADLARERRWPTWAARVHRELGVGSMMSVPVHTYGALSLYARHGQHFDTDDVAVGHTIAAHLAVVMTTAREIDHLGLALVSRIVIGRAEGILMERLDLDADRAFDYLRRVSSQTNVKLIDIAEEIARSRALPHLA
ncbi:GAF and ANTAR domain-containing protein [Nocardioides zhouii]|uniref:ANTAR domain-containing protein n=1 Tax=Nocardioides zhouii TaxID=1168729 RepID=A0A4V1RR24_9ACTN|nr:GAF and ANTAR domain-containing protein [Nocardioides zhouii]RYC14867.1 ANTAR domain-containing protein [Nocardioides zhouii]